VGLFGGDGNDYINGGAGDDDLFGESDNDSLYGESGDDAMNGGTGADKMTGGSGEDFYVVDNSGDRVIETDGGKGDLIATSISLTLPANVEDGGAIADAGSINLTGNDLENTLFGNSKSNKLRGLGDDDDIRAGGGNDILIGGKAKDKLSGEAGRDYFDFDSIAESRKGSNRDVITDFSRSQDDRIDLRSIDADTSGNPGNDTFKFIGTASFKGGGGEVRCKSGVVQADVNGDKVADLEIKINLSTLNKGDFLL
jgi:Ca2+-binding RTX toxin-like protein